RGSRGPLLSGGRFGQQGNELDENERPDFVNCKMNQQRAGGTVPDFEPQGRKAIEWFAKLGGVVRQPAPDVADRREHFLAAALLFRLSLNSLQLSSNVPGGKYLELPAVA